MSQRNNGAQGCHLEMGWPQFVVARFFRNIFNEDPDELEGGGNILSSPQSKKTSSCRMLHDTK